MAHVTTECGKDTPSMAHVTTEYGKDTPSKASITTECGIGGCAPAMLQRCASIKAFSFFCSFSLLFSNTLLVYVSSQITTLEKQFGFSSSQSGFIVSAYDVGYLSLILFISFLTSRVHRPRALFLSSLFTGFSAFVCALAYFASPFDYHLQVVPNATDTNYSETNGDAHLMCRPNFNSTNKSNVQSMENMAGTHTGTTTLGAETSYTSVAMAIISVGMIMQGIAKTPLDPYIIDYIDSNVPHTQTGLYIGITTSVSMLGPVLGYGITGYLSHVYVTLEDVPISQSDPRWIGAWWLGFIFFGILSILAGIPLLFFPNRLNVQRCRPEDDVARQSEEVQLNDVNANMAEETKAKETNRKLFSYLRGFFQALIELLRNKLFVLLVLSACFDLLSTSGMIAFTPKYLETQFQQHVWLSSLLTGVLRLVPVSLGLFFGGFIATKKKFTPVTCIKYLVVVSALDVTSQVINLFIGCSTPDIVGFNYETSNSTQCSAVCRCGDSFFPVCGTDGRNYFSPCHAGCNAQEQQIFTGCTCLQYEDTATSGFCQNDCASLIPYIVNTLVFTLILSTGAVPGFIFLIRSVPERDKGMAIGVSAFFISLLGWFPGPVLYGRLIDKACILWSSNSTHTGACSLYDNDKFRKYIYGMNIVLNAGNLVLKCVQLWMARKKTDWSGDQPRDKPEEYKLCHIILE